VSRAVAAAMETQSSSQLDRAVAVALAAQRFTALQQPDHASTAVAMLAELLGRQAQTLAPAVTSITSWDFATAPEAPQHNLLASAMNRERRKVPFAHDLLVVPSVPVPYSVFALHQYVDRGPLRWKADAADCARWLRVTGGQSVLASAVQQQLYTEEAVVRFLTEWESRPPPRDREGWFLMFYLGMQLAVSWANCALGGWERGGKLVLASHHAMWSSGQYDHGQLWPTDRAEQRPQTGGAQGAYAHQHNTQQPKNGRRL